MLVSVLRANERVLTRSVAILLLAGVTAGCSSQVARFNSADDVFTASTTNQKQIIKGEQEFPGDAPQAIEPARTGSVSRGALEPVTTRPLPAPDSAAADEPEADISPPVDDTYTGAVKQKQERVSREPEAASLDAKGWSRTGGTMITVKNGETISNLSQKYGVPSKVLVKVNGLTPERGLQAGQKLIIPTYAQDNRKAADAKSPEGTLQANPAKRSPAPEQAPADKLAVLPQPKKVKEGDSAKPADASASNDAKGKAAAGVYTVASGDTLSRISRKTGVGVAALKSANGLKDGNLRIGQKLKVPAGGNAAVASATPEVDAAATGALPPKAKAVGSEKIAAYTPPKKTDKLIEQAESSGEKAPDATGIGRMRWPVKGRVISGFAKGGGKANDGIDIAVPEGTAVKAAENGVVIYAGDGLKDFGNTVLVRHENGLVTVYGNASALKVQRGQKVKRGDEIALSGMSGNASAPKLHFEVRKNSAPVDPSTFLE